MDHIDRAIIRELQGDISLHKNPYKNLGEIIGITEAEVVDRLKALKEAGILKRISAILRHQQAGYNKNAMVVFKVSEAQIENVGAELAGSNLVSHCYQRTAYEQWPYNLYAMLHSKDANEIEKYIRDFAEKHGIEKYAILHSREELKKVSMVYDE